MALHRKAVVPGQGGVRGVPTACRLSDGYPSLWEFLTADHWPDTDPPEARETGTFTVFVELGVLKACVNDKAQKLTAFVAGSTLSELFALMDELIGSDDCSWRPSKDKPTGGRRS